MVRAAEELIKRGWKWHKGDRRWMLPNDVQPTTQQGAAGHLGTFEFFDVAKWAFDEAHGFFFENAQLEAPPLPASSSSSSGLQVHASR